MIQVVSVNTFKLYYDYYYHHYYCTMFIIILHIKHLISYTNIVGENDFDSDDGSEFEYDDCNNDDNPEKDSALDSCHSCSGGLDDSEIVVDANDFASLSFVDVGMESDSSLVVVGFNSMMIDDDEVRGNSCDDNGSLMAGDGDSGLIGEGNLTVSDGEVDGGDDSLGMVDGDDSLWMVDGDDMLGMVDGDDSLGMVDGDDMLGMVDGDDSLGMVNGNDFTNGSEVENDMRSIDIIEKEKVEHFLEEGCGCTCNDGMACSSRYSYDHISSIRDQCSSCERSQLTNLLFGHVMATVRTSKTTIKVRRQSTDRQRNTTTFLHEGEKVRHYEWYKYNKNLFLSHSFQISYIKNGLQPITHGNTFHLPSHAFTTEDLQKITSFLTNYAEEHGILLPGRIPGFKRCDLLLLPTHSTKKSIWQCYVKSSATLPFRLASYRTFCRVWQKYKPRIVITTPRSDLCWTCQRNSMNITASANKSEMEKLEVIIT